MAWLCFDVRTAQGTVWLVLEVVSFVALQAMATMSLVLNVCLREVLERSGALGKRRGKKSKRLLSGGTRTRQSSARTAGRAGETASPRPCLSGRRWALARLAERRRTRSRRGPSRGSRELGLAPSSPPARHLSRCKLHRYQV